MYKINELIESMVNGCNNQEITDRWISKKQVSFLLDIAKQQTDKVTTEFNVHYFESDKYTVNIKVSPINGAGTIQVRNRKMIINSQIEQFKNRMQELEQEIEKNKTALKSIEGNTELTILIETLQDTIKSKEIEYNSIKSMLGL